jgi:hypothetical protein
MSDFDPGWQPQPDVPLVFTIDAITSREGDYGEYKIYCGARDDGSRVAVHSFHSVLKNELADVEIGDTVKITYFGKRTGKSGKPYHAYDVERLVDAEPVSPGPPGDDIPF